jgi:two-component system, cell cycle response regulator
LFAASFDDEQDDPTPSRLPLVLVANDQEWSARSLETILGPSGYAVLRAYTGRQALELARAVRPDLVILDARLPDVDGLELCARLRDDPVIGVATPIVVTTSDSVQRTPSIEAYRAGAWEFCRHPLDAEVLLLKLGTFLRAKRLTDDLVDRGLLDVDTGLYNMRGLVRRAREVGAASFRQHGALACVVVSADAPRGPADVAGGEVPRRIAAHVAEVCRRASRECDIVGRIGHREFGIIAPATEGRGAVRLVERLQQSLEDAPFALGDGERRLGLEAGYCAVDDYAESTVDVIEMLLRAASALRDLRAQQRPSERIRSFEQTLARHTRGAVTSPDR